MSVIEQLVAANAEYAGHYPGPRPGAPALGLAVLTCMDARLELPAALGLHFGDAHLIRNAGGLVTPDVLRSLAISQHKLGTRQVVVIGHTECGMAGFDDPAFRAELAAAADRTPDWNVPGFDDVAASVASSVAAVRACAWLPHRDSVHGFVFDVRTGQLTDVD